MTPFTATARLQFHKDFTMDAAAALVPYYASLGISHLYASPLLKSRSGSTHGYDIVDHNRIDPELGGEPALRRLVAALRAHGMGLVLDIVPNHMGVGGDDNAWWLDVLEWGPRQRLRGVFRHRLGSAGHQRCGGGCWHRSWGSAVWRLPGGNGELVLTVRPEADGRLFVGVSSTHRFPD